jgi:hypothetical protein
LIAHTRTVLLDSNLIPARSMKNGARSSSGSLSRRGFCRPVAVWDAKAEQFVNDAEANAMLSRPERPGHGVGSLPRV